MVTDEQPAEIFTKGYQVAGPKFYDLYIILGVSTQSHAYSIRRIMRKKRLSIFQIATWGKPSEKNPLTHRHFSKGHSCHSLGYYTDKQQFFTKQGIRESKNSQTLTVTYAFRVPSFYDVWQCARASSVTGSAPTYQ